MNDPHQKFGCPSSLSHNYRTFSTINLVTSKCVTVYLILCCLFPDSQDVKNNPALLQAAKAASVDDGRSGKEDSKEKRRQKAAGMTDILSFAKNKTKNELCCQKENWKTQKEKERRVIYRPSITSTAQNHGLTFLHRYQL